MLKGLYILDNQAYDQIYGPKERMDIENYVDIYTGQKTAEHVAQNPHILENADVIFSGWHMPLMTSRILEAAPNLKVIFYGAGSVKSFVTDELWKRKISVTSAYAANAVPVAEYTLAQIICCLKRVWYYALNAKKNRTYTPLQADVPGVYDSTVGIISLGMTGQLVCEMLKSFSVKVIAYDPYANPEKARKLNVELRSMDDVFRHSDVVSVHTPLLPETEGFITGRHLKLMKPKSSLINTARGAIIREDEMIDVLRKREDITAILDVTCPEPPLSSSALYDLDNVIVTPHLAGSMQTECRRMGRFMVDELERYVKGEPLKWALTQNEILVMA